MLLIYIFLFFSPFFILLFIYFSFGSSLSLSQFQTRAPLSHPFLSLTSDQTHTVGHAVGHTRALILPCSSLPQALSRHRPSLFNLCCDWVFCMCIHMGLVAVVVVVVVDFGYSSGGG